MSNTRHLTALKLRVILVVSLFAIVAIIVGIFYVGRQQLSTIATAVNHANADASASADNLTTLKKIEDTLTSKSSVVDRAKKLDATSAGYDYQNEIINDLGTYARQTGVTITGVDFSAATTTTAPAAPGSGTTTMPATGSTGANKPITISVTLGTAVSYTSLLNFIYATEQNLPKLQVSRLNISRDDKTPGSVDVTSLGIDMYIN
jgi:hypothetical protein